MLPFIIAKALAFLPFGGLLRGATGKMILILVVIVALGFAYWKFKDNIRTAIVNEINQKTAEQILQDKEDQILKQNLFLIRQREINEQRLHEQKKQIENRNTLSIIIEKTTPEEDGPVAPVLRNVFEQINVFEGNVTPARENIKDVVDNDPPSALDRTVESIKSTGNSAIDAWRKLTDE